MKIFDKIFNKEIKGLVCVWWSIDLMKVINISKCKIKIGNDDNFLF